MLPRLKVEIRLVNFAERSQALNCCGFVSGQFMFRNILCCSDEVQVTAESRLLSAYVTHHYFAKDETQPSPALS
jgi:hypothetical protein